MEVWNWAAPMGHLVIFLTLQTGKKKHVKISWLEGLEADRFLGQSLSAECPILRFASIIISCIPGHLNRSDLSVPVFNSVFPYINEGWRPSSWSLETGRAGVYLTSFLPPINACHFTGLLHSAAPPPDSGAPQSSLTCIFRVFPITTSVSSRPGSVFPQVVPRWQF